MTESANISPENPTPSESDGIRFQCRNIVKIYEKRIKAGQNRLIRALDGLNLSLYNHKINALVGHSGSGKSTLSRILMRLDQADAGTIRYRHHPLQAVPLNRFRSANQILFQNSGLAVNPAFTIRKILADPLQVARKGRAEIREKIERAMETMELSQSYLKRFPSQLSGGELQRVVLARALVLEPEFVILDEPFSSLDEIVASRLIRQCQSVFKKLNIGALFISHHLKRVRIMADWIAVIRKGKIIDWGPADEVKINADSFKI